jgi:hypothetical protein
VISALLLVFFQVDLPDPPTPGGGQLTDWWRIGGLVGITVLTTGVLALIFRPGIVPSEQNQKADSRPGLRLVPPSAAPTMRRLGDPQPGSIIPFPARPEAPTEPAANERSTEAAAERLRRITERNLIPHASNPPGRRRLGSRRHTRHLRSPGPDELPETSVVHVDSPGGDPSERESRPTQEDLVVAEERSFGRELDQEEDDMFGSPDSWELLGDLANRLPSEADLPVKLLDPDDMDLLGDLVNRAPSREDKARDRPANVLPVMSGEVPTSAEVDQLAERAIGKIVQFVPRRPQTPADIDPTYELLNEIHAESQPPVDTVITQFPVDLNTREGITSTVQELLFCANVGEFMHGFALYTDKLLFRFMDDAGMNENQFREHFANANPKDPQDWTRIDTIKEFRRLDDGRVSAAVRYIDGSTPDGTERYVFKRDPVTERWLIDDITAAE